jgi:hypothetical protein
MKELFWFRLWEDKVEDLLPHREVVEPAISGVRDICISRSDPLFHALEKRYINHNGVLFTAWQVLREFTPSEINKSLAFLVRVNSIIGEFGEEYGTKYVDAKACAVCGAGAPRLGRTRLRCSRAKKI